MANIIQIYLATGARVTFETRDETFDEWKERLNGLIGKSAEAAVEPILIHDARYMPPMAERAETGYEDFWIRPGAIAAFSAWRR